MSTDKLKYAVRFHNRVSTLSTGKVRDDCAAIGAEADAQIEALTAELESLQESYGQQLAANVALRADASRYRWLRGEYARHLLEACCAVYSRKDGSPLKNWITDQQDLDAAIDATRGQT